jgi:hypothetical protein
MAWKKLPPKVTKVTPPQPPKTVPKTVPKTPKK